MNRTVRAATALPLLAALTLVLPGSARGGPAQAAVTRGAAVRAFARRTLQRRLAMRLSVAVATRSAARRSVLIRAAEADAGGWQVAITRHYGLARDASGYSAIVAPGPRDVWVFGGTNPGGGGIPVALHWNGASWRRWALPRRLFGFIGAASAPSPSDIWAVSDTGGYVLHWNGKRWTVARRWADHDDASGVTALSPADVWVFGATPSGAHGIGTWHFNGRAWTQLHGLAGQVHRASALSARDIWAVGASRGLAMVAHYNGRHWRRSRTGRALSGASLDDVLALSARDVWVVGNLSGKRGEGRMILAHYDGRRWDRVTTPWYADTGRLARGADGAVWVTADYAGSSTYSLVGHLTGRRVRWTLLRHGQGCGISDVATGQAGGRVWISGGFLTSSGGDAAVWSRRDLPARRDVIAAPARPWAAAPLDFWPRHLSELLGRAGEAPVLA